MTIGYAITPKRHGTFEVIQGGRKPKQFGRWFRAWWKDSRGPRLTLVYGGSFALPLNRR
jgi:hypothetical protein